MRCILQTRLYISSRSDQIRSDEEYFQTN